ncbi:tandem-95 repeat protein, partial [Candidatus Marinimicrobia bacterium]|nr:tandem-95 repeat protein [Candidatus Neomarinimicrobiota bacterium]
FSLTDQDLIEDTFEASINGNLLTVLFDSNFNGDVDLTIEATDGELLDYENFTITVNPINDFPYVKNPIENITLLEDFDDYIIDISDVFEDIDQDNLEYSLSVDSNDIIDASLNQSEIVVSSLPNQSGGPVQLSVTASDRIRRLSVSNSFYVEVSEVNDAPIASFSQFNIEEDQAQIIQPIFSDIDNDNSQISLSLLSQPSNGSVSIIGQGFLYTPNNDFNGQDSFSFNVFDQELYSESAEVIITTLPLNDPPSINPVSDQQIYEDSSIMLDLSASDIDGDSLTFGAQTENAGLIIDNSVLTISPDSNFNGILNIILSVTDGEYTDYTDFSLQVLNVNDAPIINEIQNQQINEDNSLSINLLASDVDGDNLVYSAETNVQADLNITGNLLIVSPEPNFNGEIDIVVSAEDSSASSSTSFTLNVLPVNDAPEIVENFNSIMNEDTSLSINLSALDIDGDSLFFQADLDNQDDASITLENNILTITPYQDWFGELLINISVSDDEGLEDFNSFVVDVLPINDSPQILSQAITLATEDVLYEYQVQIDDPDSEIFYYDLLMAPAGMTINNQGLITWLPTEGISTSGFISFVVWDTDDPQSGLDYPAIQEFQISVDSVNDAPLITSTPSSNATEDVLYEYQVVVNDIDDEEFIFSLNNHPEGMIIDNQGLITWTPQEGVLTSGLFSVNVSDGVNNNSLTDSQTYAISVTPINDAPLINSIAPNEVVQGTLYEYQIDIIDPDDDSFTFQLVNAPDGMDIDFSTFILTWIPEDYGTYGPIILKVIDGGENFVEAAQELIVIEVTPSSNYINMQFDLHQDNNLISFMGIPDDPSLSQVFAPLGENINQIITEGLAASFADNLGWIGSLNELRPDRGYWVDINEETIFEVEAIPTSTDYEYVIHDGYNLISYIGTEGAGLDEALPDYMQDDIVDIITEGLAATRIPEIGWVGSLTNRGFRQLKGYWLRNSTDSDINFSWVIDTLNLAARKSTDIDMNNQTPNEFKFNQSSKQAFYFFKDIIVNDYRIKKGDWVLAFNGNNLVGSRKWNGEYTDIPVMGYDGKYNTRGYCIPSDIPSFKVYSNETGELIDVGGNFPSWYDLATHIIELDEISIPVNFELFSAYPNPFNPTTSIEYSVPYKTDVSIIIYDLFGREIATIVNQVKNAGNYEAIWNATNVSSGMYFVKMSASNFESSQKLILIK